MSDDLFKNTDTGKADTTVSTNTPADPPKPAASKPAVRKGKAEPSGVAEFVDHPPGDNINPESLKSGAE